MPMIKQLEGSPERIYAVGDIHGCPDELKTLLDFLRTDQKISNNDQLIFIGDYIDRGPNSKKVVEMLLALKREMPKTVFLNGNHEEMFLGYLGFEGVTGAAYLQNGGGATLESYGIETSDTPETVNRKLSPVHLEFFRTLDSCVILGDYIFVHAGLHPIKSLREQDYADLHWIRNEFIYNVHHFEKTVVFGHTPFLNVLFHLPYKIGIDTGLVYGNLLSCVELKGGSIFQIKRGESTMSTRTFDAAIKDQSEA